MTAGSPWKLLTLQQTGSPVLVNTSLFETARAGPKGTWLYPRVATPDVFLAVSEPFELVCAMLTEPDLPPEPGTYTEESEAAVQAARE